MKTFKKLAALFLAALMLLSFSACSASGSSDPNAGKYIATTAETLGVAVNVSDFFPDGFTIELKDGGKCKITAGKVKANGKWTLENTDFHIKGGGIDCDGTLDRNVIRLNNVMNMGVNITFNKEGAPVIKEEYYLPYTAYSFEDAVSTARHTQDPVDSPLYGDWYGYLYITNAWGYNDNSDLILDVTGVINVDISTGRSYLDIYMDDVDGAILSFYADVYNEYIAATIGDDDAWFMNRYLGHEDGYSFSSSLYNGKLTFNYNYINPDGEDAGYNAEICIRKYGDRWDENNDLLPPGYDDYLAAIS